MDEILGRLCLNRVKPLKSPRPELLNKSILFSGFFKCKHSFTDKPMVITKVLIDSSRVFLECGLFIECFHSRCQHLCKFIGTKESVYRREEFNYHRTGLGHKHSRRFIILGHKYGCPDVMWKHTIVESALSLSTQILRNNIINIIQIQNNRIKATSSLFTSVAEDLNSGRPRTNPKSPERDSNPESPHCESDALTKRPKLVK